MMWFHFFISDQVWLSKTNRFTPKALAPLPLDQVVSNLRFYFLSLIRLIDSPSSEPDVIAVFPLRPRICVVLLRCSSCFSVVNACSAISLSLSPSCILISIVACANRTSANAVCSQGTLPENRPRPPSAANDQSECDVLLCS